MAEKGCHTLVVDHTMPCNVFVATVEAMYDLVLLEAMFTIISYRECGKKFLFMFFQLATSSGL